MNAESISDGQPTDPITTEIRTPQCELTLFCLYYFLAEIPALRISGFYFAESILKQLLEPKQYTYGEKPSIRQFYRKPHRKR